MRKWIPVVLVLVAVALAFPAGCKKKPPKSSDPGREITAPSGSMQSPATGPTTRRSPARRAAAPKSAQAACPKGAWPGHALDRDAYTLTVTVPKEVAAGKAVAAEVTVVPKAGYKVNQKYPAELTVQSAAGLAVPQKTLDKAKAATLNTHKLVFRVEATANAPGRYVVKGELGFSVCTPKLCLTEPDMCVAWEIAAK